MDLRLYELAGAVLEAVETAYAAETTAALPDRRYVAEGTPAYDCDQVTVQVTRTFLTSGGIAQESIAPLGGAQFVAEVVVSIIRCAAPIGEDGEAPSTSEIEEVAQLVLSDAVVVFDAVNEAQRVGDLPGCSGVGFAGWNAVQPSGGLTGGLATLRLVID